MFKRMYIQKSCFSSFVQSKDAPSVIKQPSNRKSISTTIFRGRELLSFNEVGRNSNRQPLSTRQIRDGKAITVFVRELINEFTSEGRTMYARARVKAHTKPESEEYKTL